MYYHPDAVDTTGERPRFPPPGATGGVTPRGDKAKRDPKRARAMNRVLIPVDGSEGALRAAAHLVGSVYHRAPPEVHLLNVQPSIMSGDVGPSVSIETVRRVRLSLGDEALRSARALMDARGISCTTAILFGKPARTIARYVKDHGIDAVVMGTRGMSALKSLLLGSVAAKVVALTEVPVTLVK